MIQVVTCLDAKTSVQKCKVSLSLAEESVTKASAVYPGICTLKHHLNVEALGYPCRQLTLLYQAIHTLGMGILSVQN